MQVPNKFMGAAVAALVVLAGCGGGDAEGPEPDAAAFLEDAADGEQAAALQEAMAQGPVAATTCRVGRPCRLSGSIAATGTGELLVDGCSPVTLTASGGAILNASFTGNLQRAGRYTVRVSSGTYRYTSKVSAMTCDTPGGPITVPGDIIKGVVAARTGNVIVVSDGRNLTATGTMIGAPPPGCTGGNRFTGTVIGLANQMVTLKGTMSCNIAGATVRVTSTVKMVEAP
jgi:hypothetical protein